MEIRGKAYCLFEQSGTFKNEFIKLGIPAEDFDIQNNYGETDHIIDLFAEIENAYNGNPSLFDNITPDDLVMAFYPCIYFESMSMMYFDLSTGNLRGLSFYDKIREVIKRADLRHYYHTMLYKLVAVLVNRGGRLIIENPATQPNYLVGQQNFIAPTMIDKNRMLRGDYFPKPTAYWFFGCEPTEGYTYQEDKAKRTIWGSKSAPKAGICSEERSMISRDYARNFICDNILGISQPDIDPQLF